MSLARRISALVLSGSLLFPVVSAGTAPPAHAGGCFKVDAASKLFVKKMNQARARHHLGRLRIDPQLAFVARHHNWRMARSGHLYHTTFGQFSRWVTRWNYIGENVGAGSGVTSLNHAFMTSPPHRANILNGRYDNVGVDTLRHGGRMWVTVQFEAARNPGTRLDMPPLCG